jgi:putative N-acetylmannosamine-6-phosphate epimerase
LESFLNDQLIDDSAVKSSIVTVLNNAARKSGKNDIAKIASNGDITIIGLDKRSIRQGRPNF